MVCNLYRELLDVYEQINYALICLLWVQLAFIFIILYIKHEE